MRTTTTIVSATTLTALLALVARVSAAPQDAQDPQRSGAPEAGASAPQEPQEPREPQEKGGLRRLDPLEEPEDGPASLESFDGSHWDLLLGEPDLDRREESFDRLVGRARRDPAARDYLEGLAGDPARPELAWTARLALRELERTGSFGFFQALPFGDPDARLGPGGGFGGRIDQLLRDFGMSLPMLPQDLRDWQTDLFRGAPPGTMGLRQESGRSMTVQKGPDGWQITITEEQDGERRTRTYTGESVEDILRQNPELEGQLGISGQGLPGGFRLHLGELGPRRLHGMLEVPGPDERWSFSRRAPAEPLRTDVLGVRVAPVGATLGTELGLSAGVGLLVSSTYPATIAQLLGVRSGDVLVELEGQPLASSEDVTRILRERAPGAGLTLTWITEGGERLTRTWKPEAPEAPRDF